jgi:hypothetical protein
MPSQLPQKPESLAASLVWFMRNGLARQLLRLARVIEHVQKRR